MSEIMRAHRWGTNAAMIAEAVVPLGYIEGRVLDATYGDSKLSPVPTPWRHGRPNVTSVEWSTASSPSGVSMEPSRGKPRLLDLFSGAGGAAMGYHRAGFDVVGCDIVKQPNYPFPFFRADALDVLRGGRPAGFDAIHASPPCQAFTAYRRKGHGVGEGYEDLIDRTRERLNATGLPWVMENVEGAPLHAPITLCGSSFGLNVRRHRLFESSFPMLAPACDHASQRGWYAPATNRKNLRRTCEIGVWRIPLETQKLAMGVDWDCTLPELSNMVPPAYTEFIGTALLASLEGPNRDY